MTKRYRLLSRAQLHGAIRDPGYVFTLEDGEVGPHRTVVASNHGAQIVDHINQQDALVDVPLYEEFEEPKLVEEQDEPQPVKERDEPVPKSGLDTDAPDAA